MSSLNILETTLPVVERAAQVAVDHDRLQELCRVWVQQELQVPGWDGEIHWSDGGPATLNYVLLLDALNFCFWSDPGQPRWGIHYRGQDYDGYKALAAALKRAVEEGVPLTDAAFLAELQPEQMESILAGQGRIPLFDERVAHAREVGQVLQQRFSGQFAQAIEMARGSAIALTELIAQHFPCFRDEATYQGQRVRLLKRAQITVVDIFGTFLGKGYGHFHDIANLTAFADYKIPQVLRAQGILCYSPELSDIVDNKVLIEAGSEAEVEIRAAMIWAVEWIRQEMERLGRTIKAYELDWFLWNVGQEPIENERPYHRTRTVFY